MNACIGQLGQWLTSSHVFTKCLSTSSDSPPVRYYHIGHDSHHDNLLSKYLSVVTLSVAFNQYLGTRFSIED